MDVLKFNSVEEKIITVRGISVILDSDVAELYGVETMRINEAVRNNPEKFPEGYVLELSNEEKREVIENFDNPKVKFSPTLPKAFTERGLYMLATILKSPRATQRKNRVKTMTLYLAPLHGITHYHFRNCFLKHFYGIDCAIAPFMAARAKDKFNPKKISDLLPENNKNIPLIPQLMGNKPSEIRDTIEVLHETFGYKQFNWNIGCPANQIVRKKRGCGVMPFPDLVEEVVSEVCGKTTIQFSLKMRLGLYAAKEGLEILQKLNPYPVHFLCIHPRLGVQQYEGNVDLDTFEIFYQNTHHKIVYSGDINDVIFFEYLQQRFPKIEDWMLGRGILQNPFLAEQMVGALRATPLPDNPTRFINFYHEYSEILLSFKNEKITLGVLKELWKYFAFFWKLNSEELQKLLRINDYQIFNKYITDNKMD